MFLIFFSNFGVINDDDDDDDISVVNGNDLYIDFFMMDFFFLLSLFTPFSSSKGVCLTQLEVDNLVMLL